jgi:predicted ATPase/DNA-binding CsgD family transcriptional regulator
LISALGTNVSVRDCERHCEGFPVSTKLPIPLTLFVGRKSELAQAADLLADARLLTFTGPGGAGKTRLALRLASTVSKRFPDGVWFADLSTLSDGTFVWDLVGTTLGVRGPARGESWAEAVSRYVAPRRALVVLDNCEHLVDSAAKVTAELLAAAPDLKVIATSREPLGVGGEVTWAVPPLNDGDGFELFSDRARRARPDLRLRGADAETVRSICRRLDGLPLAIELAAARSRAFAPTDIAAGLKSRLELLSAGPRTAPSRQTTLRASFEWSYELLSEAERVLLRQLSVFAGGFDLPAALAVCPGSAEEVLGALADRSLVGFDDTGDQSEPRYRMLETIREFAAERLVEAKEVELVRTRHRDHYLALVETVGTLPGPEQDRWRARLDSELDNLRAAIAWSRDHGSPEDVVRFLAALFNFWVTPGRITEFGVWVDAAMDQARELPPGAAAQILNFEGLLAIVSRGQLDRVPALAGEALSLARTAGDKREMAVALAMQGIVSGMAGGAEAMRPYIEEALQLARDAGFTLGLILAEVVFLVFRLFQSDPDETRRLADEAVSAAESGADLHNRLFAKAFAGNEALVHGRLSGAAELFEAVVVDGRDTVDSNYLHGLLGLAWVAMFRGDLDVARDHIAEALAAAPKRGTDSVSITSVTPIALLINGWIALGDGDAAQASQNFGLVVARARPTVAPFTSLPLAFLAQAQLGLGARGDAEASLDEATPLAREGALTWILGRVVRVRAELRARQGELHEAESLALEALNLGHAAGDQLGLVDALELMARLAVEQGRAREAVRIWSAADSRRTELGYRLVVERAAREAALTAAKEALGQDDFVTAWAEGAKLSVAEALAYASRGRGDRRRPSTGWASLTPSELEVVRLVGEHLSNPAIAARLFVSRATVKTHLVHIFAKLDIDSRSELAAEAVKRGLQAQPSLRT